MRTSLDRRTFLQALAAAGAGLSGGACSTDDTPPAGGVGDGWGTAPSSVSSLLVPPSRRPDGVLEIFLMGGLCPWDTFYVNPEYGHPDRTDGTANTQWWTFQEGYGDANLPNVFESRCGGSGQPLLTEFSTDSAGSPIHFGPWLLPLRDRPDILNRLRVVVLSHKFEPHEVASPLALTGHTRGALRMATTGAHAQRHFRGMQSSSHDTPLAYTIFSGDSEIEAQFDINAASASGLHPAWARPLALRLAEDNSALTSALERSSLNDRASLMDAAARTYLNRYASRYGSSGSGKPMMNRALEEMIQARNALEYAPRLSEVLTPELLAPVRGTVACGSQADLDTTAMGLRMATNLLTRPDRSAKYVTYIDSGLINATGAGYDTHEYHVMESSRNIMHLLTYLSVWTNRPGEKNPNKLDLDKHMVLLTSEFGRTPEPEIGKPLGLDHWPFGYVVVMIGGPIEQEQKGIVGQIDERGYATESVTPAEFRASLLMAQGIWPFTNESFAVGDVAGVETERQAAEKLRTMVLGINDA